MTNLRWQMSMMCLSLSLVAAYHEADARDTLVVMTQNQYLGADITDVVTAPNPGAFNQALLRALAQIQANNFLERAHALAEEIAARQPDVVGLQEVFNFTLNGQNGAAPYRDHLADTLHALTALGEHYVVAASVQNIQLTLPVDFDGDFQPDAVLGVTDRDVLLIRNDIVASAVPFSQFCARPSQDGGSGCNYEVVANAGSLTIERGFIGVDVAVNGRLYRVVNTHLEQRAIDPNNPLFAAIQAAQAAELIGILQTSTPAGRAIVVTGDLNSSPEDAPVLVGQTLIIPPYQQFTTDARFIDAWILRPGNAPEFTCCQLEDLANHQSLLTERIDMVFTSNAPRKVKARLVGQRVADKTRPERLWPSDHAGVVAELTFD